MVQLGADAERLLEQRDQVAQGGGLSAAEVDDLVAGQRDRQRRQHAGEDVVDVRVIAPGGSVAEKGELLSGEHPAGELVDGEVGPLPRAVDGEEAQRDRLQLVEVAPGRHELLARRFRGGVRAERRVDPRGLLERSHCVCTVYARRAAEHEPPHRSLARGLQQHGSSPHVHVHVLGRPLQAGAHAGQRGEVHDAFGPRVAERALHRLRVADVGLEEPQPAREERLQRAPLDPLRIERIEVV